MSAPTPTHTEEATHRKAIQMNNHNETIETVKATALAAAEGPHSAPPLSARTTGTPRRRSHPSTMGGTLCDLWSGDRCQPHRAVEGRAYRHWPRAESEG